MNSEQIESTWKLEVPLLIEMACPTSHAQSKRIDSNSFSMSSPVELEPPVLSTKIQDLGKSLKKG